MAEIKLEGAKREEFGKGAARRLRRDGMVPAVVYGHGQETAHIALPHHPTLLALRQANVLLEIDVAGEKNFLALPKQVQRDPIKGFIEHVDLVVVKRGEKVTVDIPVTLVGEAASETVVVQDATAISIEADATKLPEGVEVSIEGLEAGTQILAGAIELPEGTTLASDPEMLVVNVTQAISQEALEAGLEAPEGEGAAEESEAAEAEGDAEAKADDAE